MSSETGTTPPEEPKGDPQDPTGDAPEPQGDQTPPTGTRRGPLPDDFPGRAALAEAGVNTYGQLRRVSDLTAIPGIGKATAEKITAAADEPEPEPEPESEPESEPERTGEWKCLDERCVDARAGKTFTGPTQATAQGRAEPLACPTCNGQVVIYAGDNTGEAKTATED